MGMASSQHGAIIPTPCTLKSRAAELRLTEAVLPSQSHAVKPIARCQAVPHAAKPCKRCS